MLLDGQKGPEWGILPWGCRDCREALFWVDIMKKEVHCLKDGQDKLLKVFDDFVGFCAPCEDGRLVVGCGRNLLLFDPDTLDTQVLMTVDEDETNNRFNDAKRKEESERVKHGI